MFDKKNVKEALTDMFASGEISVEVVEQEKEGKGDYDRYNVQVKIDNEIVCEKGTIIVK